MGTVTVQTKTMAAASANNIALSQSPGAGAITLNGSTVANGVATIDTYNALTNSIPGRRVLITSGASDAGITFTVTGTNAAGNTIIDTFAGGATTATSNLDFVTVTSVTHTGSVASTITIGTSGVGSGPWITFNFMGESPMNLGFCVELVSGAATFTIDYSYDDPNNLPPGVATPLAFITSAFTGGKSATTDGSLTTPFIAARVSISTGTGTIRARFVQAGIG